MNESRGELRFEREPIEITSSTPKPDEMWRYTDRAGHEHYWQGGYPTLRTVVEEPYWCPDCNEEHADSHLECPLCGETVYPATVVTPWREFVPGPTQWFLDDEPISEDRAQEIMAERSDG